MGQPVVLRWDIDGGVLLVADSAMPAAIKAMIIESILDQVSLTEGGSAPSTLDQVITVAPVPLPRPRDPAHWDGSVAAPPPNG